MRFSVSSLASAVAPVVVGAVVLLSYAPDAKADYYVRRAPEQMGTGLNLGLDLEGASDATPPQNTSGEGGGGFKLRIGAEIRRPYLRIIPEGGFGYTHLFVSDNAGDNVGWNMERLFVGVRIGFGEVIVPIIYGHIGYGWRTTGTNDTIGAGSAVPGASGLTGDGGIGLDFHFIRHVGFGLHAEYVTVQANPATPDWIAVGAHMDVRF
jgi:hypothetical protein